MPTLTIPGRARRGARRERTCVVTRAVKPVDELIRFVVAPDGAVVPDLKRRLPGRGVWVTATRAAVDEAVQRKGFARGFKREVRAARRPCGARSSGCWSARRSMRSASPTRPAGSRSASRKTESELAGGPVAAVLQAADASADGARKIAAAAARRQAGTNAGPNPGDRGVYDGAIGFGIGAVKCGTCCPARRPSEQRVPCALPEPRTLPDH